MSIGRHTFKTPREIELEAEVEVLREELIQALEKAGQRQQAEAQIRRWHRRDWLAIVVQWLGTAALVAVSAYVALH